MIVFNNITFSTQSVDGSWSSKGLLGRDLICMTCGLTQSGIAAQRTAGTIGTTYCTILGTVDS